MHFWMPIASLDIGTAPAKSGWLADACYWCVRVPVIRDLHGSVYISGDNASILVSYVYDRVLHQLGLPLTESFL